ncbi:MAG: transcriptional regulator [Frankiales bacterium]|nr:transcriptional regulator [Frankiales bacterium]
MTSAASQQRPDGSPRAFEQMADVVEELACLLGGGCLVEGTRGQLVAHAFPTLAVPPLLMQVVVSGDAQRLHTALTARRTTGLLAGRPVIEGCVDGLPVAHVALAEREGVWLITDGRPLDLAQLQEPVRRLAGLLAISAPDATQSTLADLLRGIAGRRLPDALAGAETCWVAAVLRAEPVDRQPIRPVAGVVHAWLGAQLYLVVAGTDALVEDEVLRRLEQAVGADVTIGLSPAGSPTELARAKRQADIALSEAAPGTVVPLRDVRSVVAVREMAKAAERTPDLGHDPLQKLLDHDAQRGGDLVASLGAWLDSFGDIAVAAARLTVHPNTLRYRLRRAVEVLDVNVVEDPFARLEIHARLLARV